VELAGRRNGVDLAHKHRKVRLEHVGIGEFLQAGVGRDGRQHPGDVGRDHGTRLPQQLIAKTGDRLDLEMTAGPEAGLLGIHVQGDDCVAPIGVVGLSPAAGYPLWHPVNVHVERDALLGHVIPQTAPVAGKPGPRGQVSAPGCGNRFRHGKRWGQTAQGSEQDRQPDGCFHVPDLGCV